jgi:hypothetical protein
MPAKNPRRAAAGRKGAQTRKRNILLAEGWTLGEIADKRLDRRSFKTRDMRRLRDRRIEGVTEGDLRFSNVRNPEQRRALAIQFASEFGQERRLRQQRTRGLDRDGFTPSEISIKRLETISSRNPALKIVRARRRREIQREIARLLPAGQKRQAGRIFREQGTLFDRARDIVANRDRQLLNRMGKDYPFRLLDLYAMGA